MDTNISSKREPGPDSILGRAYQRAAILVVPKELIPKYLSEVQFQLNLLEAPGTQQIRLAQIISDDLCKLEGSERSPQAPVNTEPSVSDNPLADPLAEPEPVPNLVDIFDLECSFDDDDEPPETELETVARETTEFCLDRFRETTTPYVNLRPRYTNKGKIYLLTTWKINITSDKLKEDITWNISGACDYGKGRTTIHKCSDEVLIYENGRSVKHSRDFDSIPIRLPKQSSFPGEVALAKGTVFAWVLRHKPERSITIWTHEKSERNPTGSDIRKWTRTMK